MYRDDRAVVSTCEGKKKSPKMIHQISRAWESQTFASGTRLEPQSSQPRLVQYQERGGERRKCQQNELPILSKNFHIFPLVQNYREIQVSTDTFIRLTAHVRMYQ